MGKWVYPWYKIHMICLSWELAKRSSRLQSFCGKRASRFPIFKKNHGGGSPKCWNFWGFLIHFQLSTTVLFFYEICCFRFFLPFQPLFFFSMWKGHQFFRPSSLRSWISDWGITCAKPATATGLQFEHVSMAVWYCWHSIAQVGYQLGTWDFWW